MATFHVLERGHGSAKTDSLVATTTSPQAVPAPDGTAALHADLFGGTAFKPPKTPALRLVKAST